LQKNSVRKTKQFNKMIEIEKAIVSLSVVEEEFSCNFEKCKGICCVDGDSGAPLNNEEVEILEKHFDQILPFLSTEGKFAIKKQGKWITDPDGDKVTPLIFKRECAYTVFDNNIATCAIEKAYFEGKIGFRKPISCHLYPIRITKYDDFDAVNYDRQDICFAARLKGQSEGTPVYVFLKDALIRKYGEAWYQQLQAAAQFITKKKSQNVAKR